ncbi:hypothetical protein A2Z22_03820 [Candidatus Woesebacteria bacterium RBG_16_34_12]|uniref:Uncharacterized protein n=1 Tax=Candidatus Woesebacteria bacterium RBG_16_34_12 TaxID=1802480 RepID=A0A1F7X9B9_9BACT|nr:MAG: hypothetical protein A2Z22_03820 [Candidatus Woesebacteria bacterium RBG_16_34_12]
MVGVGVGVFVGVGVGELVGEGVAVKVNSGSKVGVISSVSSIDSPWIAEVGIGVGDSSDFRELFLPSINAAATITATTKRTKMNRIIKLEDTFFVSCLFSCTSDSCSSMGLYIINFEKNCQIIFYF